MASQAGSAGRSLGSSFADSAKQIKDSNSAAIGTFRGLLGQVAAVGATAGTFYAVGRSIREGVNTALEEGTDRARQFATGLQGVSPDNLKKTTDELERLRNLLAEAESGNLWDKGMVALGVRNGAAFGDTASKLKEQADELERLQTVQGQGVRKQKFQGEQAEAEKAAKDKAATEQEENKRTTEQLQRDRDAVLLDTLDNEDRIREEGQQRLREAYSKLDSARTDEQKRLAQEVIDLEYERLDRAYSELTANRFKDQQEAQKKLQDDEKKHLKEVKDIRLQTEREVAALREDLERGFSRTDLTFYQNDEVLSELRRNTRATERLGF